MQTTWFFLLSFMLIVYVVLDGFDFGAGILHLFVAKTDRERRTIFAAIGPVWDGNEVWLLAFGGVLVFSFPKVYATAFSGFYLPLMMVLWLLVMRGIAIEFRSHLPNPLWRAFWDAAFTLGSTLVAIVLGVALGNVIRGVPIEATGYFRAPLFGDFTPGSASGAIDWFTLAVGVFALLTLAAHGAVYLQWKTSGAIADRCRRAALGLWIAVVVLGAAVTVATAFVQPIIFANLLARPPLYVFPFWIAASLAGVFLFVRTGRELLAFLSSAAFIVGMLAATAGALYPTILFSTVDPSLHLTVHNASAGRSGLVIGLVWWVPAMALATGYFAYLFRSFRGKVESADDGHGY